MRTVQKYLQEIEEEKVISAYLYSHPVDFEQLKESTELSIAEVRKRIEEHLRAIVKRLRNLSVEAAENGEEYVLYAHKTYKDVCYSLLCLQMSCTRLLFGDLVRNIWPRKSRN